MKDPFPTLGHILDSLSTARAKPDMVLPFFLYLTSALAVLSSGRASGARPSNLLFSEKELLSTMLVVVPLRLS